MEVMRWLRPRWLAVKQDSWLLGARGWKLLQAIRGIDGAALPVNRSNPSARLAMSATSSREGQQQRVKKCSVVVQRAARGRVG